MLDILRARYPKFGFALYALEPGKPVTLEVLTDSGELYSFTEATEDAVFCRAFPNDVPARTPDLETVPTNVFD